jgi:heme-degrading monooxygenase HmoA
MSPIVVRLWKTRIDESRADEYLEFARTRSVPMFSSQHGFLGVVFLAASGERLVATIWESHEAAADLEASPSYEATVAAIEATGFLEGESVVETFELEGASLPGPDCSGPVLRNF